MLETWNLCSTDTYVASENIPFSNALNFASTFTQSNIVRAVLEFFSPVFSFSKIKGYYLWKCKFYRLCVRNLAPNWQKNWKNDNDRHGIIVSSFWCCFVSLVKFSYWFKFHINIITGSGGIAIFFYKGLTRNPEMGNTRVWVLSNIWRLERGTDTKFGTNVSYKMLLNAAIASLNFLVKLPPNQIRLSYDFETSILGGNS